MDCGPNYGKKVDLRSRYQLGLDAPELNYYGRFIWEILIGGLSTLVLLTSCAMTSFSISGTYFKINTFLQTARVKIQLFCKLAQFHFNVIFKVCNYRKLHFLHFSLNGIIINLHEHLIGVIHILRNAVFRIFIQIPICSKHFVTRAQIPYPPKALRNM
jgi:hypothetical protein